MDKLKNIFVVSWIKSENYGTCLQAYATYETLKKYANVRFVGKRRFYSFREYKYVIKRVYSEVKQKIHPKHTYNYGEYNDSHKIKLKKIDKFVNETYELFDLVTPNDIKSLDAWADHYIVGSDQMWNPWMLSPTYLLDFVPRNTKNRIWSYAASFGVDNIPNERKGVYRRLLKKFDSISVREPRGAELVKELVGMNAQVVCDPTLLLTQHEWREFSMKSDSCEQYKLKNDYILCYYIGSQEFDHLQTVRKIADILGLKIVLLPIKEQDYMCENNDIVVIADACLFDFVRLIDNAALVCTDSFHAVVFSFLMSTPFYCFPRFKKGYKYSQESRLHNIIDTFGLADSYWKDDISADKLTNHLKCDYSAGFSRLEIEREKSIKYILDNIQK